MKYPPLVCLQFIRVCCSSLQLSCCTMRWYIHFTTHCCLSQHSSSGLDISCSFGDCLFLKCLSTTRYYGKKSHQEKCYINPLKPELNPICYLLALLAHHFLHVSRIRVKSLSIRLLMSYIYIYMEHLFLMFLDHTQRRSGRSPAEIVGSNPTGGMDICLL